MAGNNKTFGSLVFKRLLRTWILGLGDTIPVQLSANVKRVEASESYLLTKKVTNELAEKSNDKVISCTINDAVTNEKSDMPESIADALEDDLGPHYLC